MKKRRKHIKHKIVIIVMVLIMFVMIKNVYKEFQRFISLDEISLFQKEKTINRLSQDDPQVVKIFENKEKYPDILLEMLQRNPDMLEYVSKYEENKGKVFAKNIGSVSQGIYPLLLQYDTKWGYGIYGDNVIAINGCGPTSVAMVVAGLTGRNDYTPYDIARYAYKHGYYQDGTRWSFFTQGVRAFGISGREIPLSKLSMLNELKQGHPIICSMRKGDFTTTGHIITIVGVKNGRFVINDPNSRERSQQLWDYERIEGQIKNLWAFQRAEKR